MLHVLPVTPSHTQLILGSTGDVIWVHFPLLIANLLPLLVQTYSSTQEEIAMGYRQYPKGQVSGDVVVVVCCCWVPRRSCQLIHTLMWLCQI